jgi:hypothetical protein
MILAVLIGAFEPENLEKFENDQKDERIEKEKERFKRLFRKIFCRSSVVSPDEKEISNLINSLIKI